MKRVFGLIAVTGIVAIGAPAVSAQSYEYIVSNDQLDVTGRVIPVQSVIINNEGAIIQILSNTTEDVEPRVYLNQINPDSRVDLTDKVRDEYRKLVPAGSAKVGTLYDISSQPRPVEEVLNSRISSILPNF